MIAGDRGSRSWAGWAGRVASAAQLSAHRGLTLHNCYRNPHIPDWVRHRLPEFGTRLLQYLTCHSAFSLASAVPSRKFCTMLLLKRETLAVEALACRPITKWCCMHLTHRLQLCTLLRCKQYQKWSHCKPNTCLHVAQGMGMNGWITCGTKEASIC